MSWLKHLKPSSGGLNGLHNQSPSHKLPIIQHPECFQEDLQRLHRRYPSHTLYDAGAGAQAAWSTSNLTQNFRPPTSRQSSSSGSIGLDQHLGRAERTGPILSCGEATGLPQISGQRVPIGVMCNSLPLSSSPPPINHASRAPDRHLQWQQHAPSFETTQIRPHSAVLQSEIPHTEVPESAVHTGSQNASNRRPKSDELLELFKKAIMGLQLNEQSLCVEAQKWAKTNMTEAILMNITGLAVGVEKTSQDPAASAEAIIESVGRLEVGLYEAMISICRSKLSSIEQRMDLTSSEKAMLQGLKSKAIPIDQYQQYFASFQRDTLCPTVANIGACILNDNHPKIECTDQLGQSSHVVADVPRLPFNHNEGQWTRFNLRETN